MKFEVSAKQFRDAFSQAGRVVPSNSPKPVLKCVLMQADGDSVKLIATDTNVQIEVPVSGVTVREPGKVLLPKDVTDRILKASDTDNLAFAAAGNKIEVETFGTQGKRRSAKWSAQTEDPDLFPVRDTADVVYVAGLAGAEFKAGVPRATAACDVKGGSWMSGVLLELSESAAKFVATDGRRMSLVTLARTVLDSASAPDRPVVPAGLLRLAIGCVAGDTSVVAVGFPNDRSIVFGFGNDVVLSGQLLEGKFARYQAIFDGIKPDNRVTVRADELLAAIEAASVANDQVSRAASFEFSAAGLTITREVEASKAEVQCDIEFKGAATTALYDPAYIPPDVFRGIDDEVVWTGIHAKLPSRIDVESAGLTYVVMPMNLT